MSAAALALLPLIISGYLFNLIFYPFRYFSSRAEGQKLFFMAAGSGLFLGAAVFVGSALIKSLSFFESSLASEVAREIDAAIPVPHACKLLFTLFFAVGLAYLFNLILWLKHLYKGKSTGRCVYDNLTEKFGNPLDQLFRRAAETQKLVMITFQSRKIYCGRVMEVPGNLDAEGAFIEILPSFSGYRDKDTLSFGGKKTEYPVITLWEVKQYIYSIEQRLEITEQHLSGVQDERVRDILDKRRGKLEHDLAEARAVLAGVREPPDFDPNDWIKVFPVAEIESASFYDSRAYEVWFRGESGLSEQAGSH